LTYLKIISLKTCLKILQSQFDFSRYHKIRDTGIKRKPKYNMNINGFDKANQFVLHMNGHKFAGHTVSTVEWDLDVGAEIVYTNANYGLGIR